MANARIKKDAHFTVDSALLEELGERLVSRPEIALAELIKNSYDADASECKIKLFVDDNRLAITDNGLGMTEQRFCDRWMKIGTKNKADERVSALYRRRYSGSKGVGRFAARFLGTSLELKSVAFDPAVSKNTTLTASFDWTKSTRAGSLEQFKITYFVEVTPNAPVGTELVISGGSQVELLRGSIKTVANSVFELTSPLGGLEKPAFFASQPTSSKEKGSEDPGFSIIFEGSDDEALSEHKALEEQILSRYVARSRIEINDTVADVSVEFPGRGVVFQQSLELQDFFPTWAADSPVFIDIRYFPRRAGFFSGAEVDGRQALRWLRDHGGVALIENKFRVVPYGQRNDDWLLLDADVVRNQRRWRSPLISSLFPMAPSALSVERDNAMLYLPQNSQLVGAVYVAPKKSPGIPAHNQLVQAINREGYLENRAFQSVRDVARSAVELIAYFDHKFAREAEEQEFRLQVQEARGDLSSAIREISRSPVIAPEDKQRLVQQLRGAQERVGDAERYQDQIRNSLEQMSLLGVLSGFLTHEYEKTLFRLDGALATIRKISKQHPALKDDLVHLGKSRDMLVSYLDYARLFTTAVGDDNRQPFDAGSQIELVLKTLEDFQKKHKINVEINASSDLELVGIPLAAYSGIVMNLITNAFKALVARSDKGERTVSIAASLAGNRHVLAVSDTGIGIPAGLRSRIWDPLYSTTRSDNSSLGSGMGLGLTLVRRVVQNMNGRIEVMEKPLSGFSTTFRVELPIRGRADL